MTRNMIQPASRVDEVRYEIGGPLARRATELERQGHEILQLNIADTRHFRLTLLPEAHRLERAVEAIDELLDDLFQ